MICGPNWAESLADKPRKRKFWRQLVLVPFDFHRAGQLASDCGTLKGMATLIPVAFVEGTKSAFVWKCSECDFAISLSRVTDKPSFNELQVVNGSFSVHCRHEHPNSPVVGLMIPAMGEDSAQIAFRVLREATKGK
jgi:hypothetical protein